MMRRCRAKRARRRGETQTEEDEMSENPHANSARKVVLRAATLAIAVAGFLALGAGQAAPYNHGDDVNCGDTITTDVKLKRDLIDCPGHGLVIGADNIELDLNGHTIDGDGALGCADFYACDYGVDNTAGHHGVTIENGTIREFATAVFMLGAADTRVSALSSSDNVLGGLLLIGCTKTQIERNSISRNGLATDQAGLIVFDSTDLRLERNSVFANGDIGMFLIGLDSSRLERNSVSGNPEAGVVLEGSGNDLSGNHVFGNGDNIAVMGDDNIVTRNEIDDALGFPDDPTGGFGILLVNGDRNLFQGNDVDGAASNGIRVRHPEETGTADNNVLRDNEVEHTKLDGIAIDAAAPGSLVEHNAVLGAADDGIDVESPTTTLTRNRTDGNGDLGIEAVAGVTDGGGNRASGNGNPAQCQGVDCS
jgi:parallel beta-helix repeat protein